MKTRARGKRWVARRGRDERRRNFLSNIVSYAIFLFGTYITVSWLVIWNYTRRINIRVGLTADIVCGVALNMSQRPSTSENYFRVITSLAQNVPHISMSQETNHATGRAIIRSKKWSECQDEQTHRKSRKMSESLATYLTNSPFTPEQERKIKRYLDIIKDSGGFGTVEIEVKDSQIKFINLKEVRGLVETK